MELSRLIFAGMMLGELVHTHLQASKLVEANNTGRGHYYRLRAV